MARFELITDENGRTRTRVADPAVWPELYAPGDNWYKRNACPACATINGTGRLCEKTVTCVNCGSTVCFTAGGRCRVCGKYFYVKGDVEPVDFFGSSKRIKRSKRE